MLQKCSNQWFMFAKIALGGVSRYFLTVCTFLVLFPPPSPAESIFQARIFLCVVSAGNRLISGYLQCFRMGRDFFSKSSTHIMCKLSFFPSKINHQQQRRRFFALWRVVSSFLLYNIIYNLWVGWPVYKGGVNFGVWSVSQTRHGYGCPGLGDKKSHFSLHSVLYNII